MLVIYSFSMLMVEIFTRDDPYSELSYLMEPGDIIEAVRDKMLRPNISDLHCIAVKTIIKKSWNEDPYKRPSFSQLRKQLQVWRLFHSVICSVLIH